MATVVRANMRFKLSVRAQAAPGGRDAAAAARPPAERHFTLSPARGSCDLPDAKMAKEACVGLTGANQDACWAQFGCDVHAVTDHYSKAAGLQPPSRGSSA